MANRWRASAVAILLALLVLSGWAGEPAVTTVNAAVDVAVAKSGDATASANNKSKARSQRPIPHIAISVVASDTSAPIARFRVIAGVPTSRGIAEDLAKQAGVDFREIVTWQPHTLRVGMDGKLDWALQRLYAETSLRIEAAGFQTQHSAWIRKEAPPRELQFRMKPERGEWGQLICPSGEPAANATIAVGLPMIRSVAIRDGQIVGANQPAPANEIDRWRRPIFTTSDAEGQFVLPHEPEDTSTVLIAHESGVRRLSYSEFLRQRQVMLQEWGRIDGLVLWGDKPGAEETISLGLTEVMTDSNGRFTLEKVMPGRTYLARRIKLPEPREDGITSVSLPGLTTVADVEPGGVTQVVVGGQGRSVHGRLVGLDSWQGVTLRLHPDAPHFGFPGDDSSWTAFAIFRRSEIGPLFFHDAIRPNDDGTFLIADILPGRYQLFVQVPGQENFRGYRELDVASETYRVKPLPLDLGEIKVTLAKNRQDRK